MSNKKKLVALTGAGISAESGLPTFSGKAMENVQDFSKPSKSFFEPRFERLEINIYPLIPLFFSKETFRKAKTFSQKGYKYIRREGEKNRTINFILNDIQSVNFMRIGDLYVDHPLTGLQLLINVKGAPPTEKDIERTKIQLAELIYGDFFQITYDNLTFTKGRDVDGYERQEYSQFVGRPVEAAHFLIQQSITKQTQNLTNMVCKNVIQVEIEGYKISVDFVFRDMHDMLEIAREHLSDFRFWRKYGDRGNNPRFYTDPRLDIRNLPSVDFSFAMDIMRRTLNKTKGIYVPAPAPDEKRDKNHPSNKFWGNDYIEYYDNKTGWAVLFAPRGEKLELMTIYNKNIPEEKKFTVLLSVDMLMKETLDRLNYENKKSTMGDFFEAAKKIDE